MKSIKCDDIAIYSHQYSIRICMDAYLPAALRPRGPGKQRSSEIRSLIMTRRAGRVMHRGSPTVAALAANDAKAHSASRRRGTTESRGVRLKNAYQSCVTVVIRPLRTGCGSVAVATEGSGNWFK